MNAEMVADQRGRMQENHPVPAITIPSWCEEAMREDGVGRAGTFPKSVTVSWRGASCQERQRVRHSQLGWLSSHFPTARSRFFPQVTTGSTNL